MSRLLRELVMVFKAAPVRPFAFFGHSLGALVAFETARKLAQSGLPQPMHLFVSGCHAPQFRRHSKYYHLLNNEALLRALETTSRFASHWFSGGHFFINEHRGSLLELMTSQLGRVGGPGGALSA